MSKIIKHLGYAKQKVSILVAKLPMKKINECTICWHGICFEHDIKVFFPKIHVWHHHMSHQGNFKKIFIFDRKTYIWTIVGVRWQMGASLMPPSKALDLHLFFGCPKQFNFIRSIWKNLREGFRRSCPFWIC